MKGKKFSYLCPNGTLFHQQHLVCAHWYQVNCTKTAELYKINEQMFPYGKNETNDQDNSPSTLKDSITPNASHLIIKDLLDERKNNTATRPKPSSASVQNVDSLKSIFHQEATEFGNVIGRTKSETAARSSIVLEKESQFLSPANQNTDISVSEESQTYEDFGFGTKSIIVPTTLPNLESINEQFQPQPQQDSIATYPSFSKTKIALSPPLPIQAEPHLSSHEQLQADIPPLGPLPPGHDEFGLPLGSAWLTSTSPSKAFTKGLPYYPEIVTEVPYSTSIPYGNQLHVQSTEFHLEKLFESVTPGVKHKLTMKFHDSGYFKKLGSLPINEKCPLCNPYFLKKGECFPCVTIR